MNLFNIIMLPAALLACIFCWGKLNVIARIEKYDTSKKINTAWGFILIFSMLLMMSITSKGIIVELPWRIAVLTICAVILIVFSIKVKGYIMILGIIFMYFIQLKKLLGGFHEVISNCIMLFGTIVILTIDVLGIWNHLQKRKANTKE